jgi:hypothetical protein
LALVIKQLRFHGSIFSTYCSCRHNQSVIWKQLSEIRGIRQSIQLSGRGEPTS